VPELVECNLSFVTGRPRRHVEDSLVELDVVCAWIPVKYPTQLSLLYWSKISRSFMVVAVSGAITTPPGRLFQSPIALLTADVYLEDEEYRISAGART
jgi:hypothetical protein